MTFWEIFRFEFTYQARRAWPWLIVVVLLGLVFLFMRDGSFGEALYTEFFINSPFMIAMATVFGNLLWLVMAAFIAGEAASRDVATGMHSLTYTVPITKAQYLGGRFVAAFALNAFILLFVQISILLAIYLPGVHPDSMGPFRPIAFITAYYFIALPNAFAGTALQFGLSLQSGRPMSAYIASLVLFFTAFFIASMILFRSELGPLLDPIGVRFIWDELSHLWTNVEKSHRLLELKGTLLKNRLIWIGAGLAYIALTYLRFQFRHRVATSFRFRLPFVSKTNPASIVRPSYGGPEERTYQNLNFKVKRSSGIKLLLRQTITIAWTSFRSIATSWTGLGLLLFIPLLAIPVVIDQMVSLSLPLTPTTARVIAELTGPLSADMSRWIVIPGFIIYFVGELVWRERDHGLGEITDAMPGSEWATALGKFFGIVLLLIAFMIMLSCAGIAAQMLMGHHDFEIQLYLKGMFGIQLPEYVLFAVLALFIHAVADQKYVGHLAAICTYAFIAAIATMLGIEHNMLIYGAGPGWSYTEMRGFGLTITPWLWFKLYWAAWALLLLVAGVLFWPRGKERNFSIRLHLARDRFRGKTMLVAGIGAIMVLSVGGFIFYNTNILNVYRNSSDLENWQAAYERWYGRFEDIIQPEIRAAKLHVEIYPEKRSVNIQGSYHLVNVSATDIDSIHISTSVGGATTGAIYFDRNATLALSDDHHHYRIYHLANPLKQGDTLQLNFEVAVSPKGFTNRGMDPAVKENGTFFNNLSWFPSIGYLRTRGIINPAIRREHGLEPRPVIAALSEAHEGDAVSLHAGILFDAVIGTNADEVAVAPGALRRTWTDKGRRYFHYASSGAIGSEWSFFSAKYNVYEKEFLPSKAVSVDSSRGNPVFVRIYHHPEHTAHLEHMMRGITSSLEYYSEQFGNYPYNHLTVVEHPDAPGTGMHAYASMIYYGQGYAHWLPKDDHELDLPYAIMGHEMGHQWTLPYAFVEGLPFLSEGLAWHYGIMLMQATRSAEQTRRLMSFMRQPYPHQPIRRGEPLLRALDPYLAYKRGPLAMYALSKYAGADRVNSAIRTLNQKSDMPGAPAVTTLDLYHELKAVTPDSLQNMLHDFFEVNTLWMFETTRVKAIKTGNDQWQVTLNVKAKKIVYDSAGVETERPLDEWIPIGVFAESKPGQDELAAPLYLKMHRVHAGEQTIMVTVSEKPVLAGIDPHHLLDWEEKEDDDNIYGVIIGRDNISEK